MLVYGDPQFEEKLGFIRKHIKSTLAHARTNDLDQWRMILIQAGQLEQALADVIPDNSPVNEAARQLTDAAAQFFCHIWASETGNFAGSVSISETLSRIDTELRKLESEDERVLTIKVPEGFEFYALFPEQYALAALSWARAQKTTHDILVVGIRSIGTTLSAVSTSILRLNGWPARRHTVRPTGHPFARRAEISPEFADMAESALIVDEGPGISGSSMVAAAEALVRAGFNEQNLSFLPGHKNAPGPQATPEIRRWWEKTPRYCAELDELKWLGGSLAKNLAELTEEYLPGAHVRQTVDLIGGSWCGDVLPHSADWPPIYTPFERLKYRCECADGRSVLWKFNGLGAMVQSTFTAFDLAWNDLNASAFQQWTPAPIGYGFGFIGMPWIGGQALTRRDLNERFILSIGSYLLHSIQPPLKTAEASDSYHRLARILRQNATEALESSDAAGVSELCERAVAWFDEQPAFLLTHPTSGDGRMAPHEWLRDVHGELFKTDTTGNMIEHTLVGKQPFLWDVAGAMVEWDMDDAHREILIQSMTHSGIEIPDGILDFYVAGYAAFKMGQSRFCYALTEPESPNRSQLDRSFRFYRERLISELKKARFAELTAD